MDTETLRIDLQRTQDRIARAREVGDTTGAMIAEARLRRVAAELETVLGIQRPTTTTARTTAGQP